MNWKTFTPDPARAEALRPVILRAEGMNPHAPVRPIKGIAPPKCDKCGDTLPFIMTDYKIMSCPRGCGK